MGNVKPVSINAFLLCDAVSREPGSGKVGLVGLFDGLVFEKDEPLSYGPAFLYYLFDFGKCVEERTADVSVVLIGSDNQEKELLSGAMKIECSGHEEGALALPRLEFDSSGMYLVEMKLQKETIAKTKIDVIFRMSEG